ncbi:MAG: efflux RND transporter periplasmic adaptor subunit [Deltaproteobacteria bacterium]|nr:efflux RND transporter periplasmic adaptor subunit [Deltaproteobacteria bacterium]MBW2419855.1 efflux RND transporter periplasmic adaptor subunit [Deltaproteobacteria bacterium]
MEFRRAGSEADRHGRSEPTLACVMALAVALLVGLAFVGCGEDAAPPETPPPAVTVAEVVEEDILETVDFVGEVRAVEMVALRARVQGFLEERRFREGSLVAEDEILYVIEQGPYAAELDRLNAELVRAEAQLANARAELERKEALFKQRTLSDSAYESAVLTHKSAMANLQAAGAAARRGAMDLSYTTIHAPFGGRIGRSSVDAGNLVGPAVGVLATLSQIDPVYVDFKVNERLFLAYSQQVLEQERRGEAPGTLVPRLRLSDGSDYSHEGELDFVDKDVDASTGSIGVRAIFSNPDELLRPGQYVTVLLSAEDPVSLLLVPQAAVQEKQAGRFVLVVDGEDRVEERKVVTGDRVGSRWSIVKGLEKGERVIVRGLQKVRPGLVVNPTFDTAHVPAEG